MKIIPVLKQIGFDESITWTVFNVAAPAWEKMGPLNNKQLWFNPKLIKDLEEVRVGVLQKAADKLNQTLSNDKNSAGSIRDMAEQGSDPANLWQLLGEISTSWIILPRAYPTLEDGHSNAMTGYIEYLVRETNPEFRKIMARIITEYVGNFTLKFLVEKDKQERMSEVVFYGYAAMFWRNLLNPPPDFEESEIHKNFLRWAIMFNKRNSKSRPHITAMLSKMVHAAQSIFSDTNAFGLCNKGKGDRSRFLIALRHGRVGIDAVCNHFGTGGKLRHNATNASVLYSDVPQKLSRFLRLIRQRISQENPKTRQFIHDFMVRLKADYELLPLSLKSPNGPPVLEKLRFAPRRVVAMIVRSGFARSLTNSPG